MEKFLKRKQGYTGVDISIAIIVLFILLTIISTIFINIYMQSVDTQRNAMAMTYATTISELIDKMYYQDINDENEGALKNRIRAMNIPNGYTVDVEVTNYMSEGYTQDLVKKIQITVNYKVGSNNKNIRIEKIKSKEILIIPNKPKTINSLVPVKYIISDNITKTGYWQITSENDSTWYNYENKTWAFAMLANGLTVEGGITVTEENKASLVGKRVTTEGYCFAWIPRYIYDTDENLIKFVYSNSNRTINENGNLVSVPNYTINEAFDSKTGFWISTSEINNMPVEIIENVNASQMTNEDGEAVTDLSESIYGNNSEIWENLTSARYIIDVD